MHDGRDKLWPRLSKLCLKHWQHEDRAIGLTGKKSLTHEGSEQEGQNLRCHRAEDIIFRSFYEARDSEPRRKV